MLKVKNPLVLHFIEDMINSIITSTEYPRIEFRTMLSIISIINCTLMQRQIRDDS